MSSLDKFLYFSFLLFLLFSVCVCADILNMPSGQASLVFVPIGNSGNTSDTRYYAPGEGRVNYTYSMGMFEVTAAQYCEFLNAVAGEDFYGLYNPDMGNITNAQGCNIQRSGLSGSYTYFVPAEWANRPVNYVSWGDAARFCNWLTNNQPTGSQNLTTTEDGSYFLNGALTNEELNSVTRKVNAKYAVPNNDEWYKAAFHYNDGVTGNYYDYPANTDTPIGNELSSPDPGNNANYYYTIGEPYYRTEAGDFENSAGPYGTYDQGGNVWEWNEFLPDLQVFGLRGGSFDATTYRLSAADRYSHGYYLGPSFEGSNVGFRILVLGAYCGDEEHPYPPGDLTRDCRVNLDDLAIICQHWLECSSPECDQQ